MEVQQANLSEAKMTGSKVKLLVVPSLLNALFLPNRKLRKQKLLPIALIISS